jgi:hypothetical protein
MLPRMAGHERSFVVYVDDSGNQDVGVLWTALAIPLDRWTEYLGRWQSFRRFLSLITGDDGEVLPLLTRTASARRARFETFEKGLKTIGTFTEARILTTFKAGRKGKISLYSDLLSFLESFLTRENALAVVIVDGGHDSGGPPPSMSSGLGHQTAPDRRGCGPASISREPPPADG